VASLEHFRGRVTEIADRAIGILRRLDQDVFTAENNTQLNAFVANLGSVADDLRTVTARVRRQELSTDVARLVQQVSRVAETADRLLSDLHDRQDEMLGGVAETLRHINEVATETRELVRGAQAELSSTGGSVGTLVSELSAATNRLEETLDVIRSDPSLLLRGRDLPAREFAR